MKGKIGRAMTTESRDSGRPDKEGSLQDDGGHVGGRSISWQDGPQEEHCCEVVDIGGCLVGTHRIVEAHDDEGEHQLVSNARPQEVVVHDVPPHAVLQPADTRFTTKQVGGRISGATMLVTGLTLGLFTD